jgi:hypothetical protein
MRVTQTLDWKIKSNEAFDMVLFWTGFGKWLVQDLSWDQLPV